MAPIGRLGWCRPRALTGRSPFARAPRRSATTLADSSPPNDAPRGGKSLRRPRSSADKLLFGASRSRPNFLRRICLGTRPPNRVATPVFGRVPRMRRAGPLVMVCLGVLLWGVAARPVAAHPLGNFTVNHYSRVVLTRDAVQLRYVLDLAEIPSVQESRAADTDGTGTVSPAEWDAYK